MRVRPSSDASGSLQVGQRFAKPGLSGLSSNSSQQTTQTLIGNAISVLRLLQDGCAFPAALKCGRAVPSPLEISGGGLDQFLSARVPLLLPGKPGISEFFRT